MYRLPVNSKWTHTTDPFSCDCNLLLLFFELYCRCQGNKLRILTWVEGQEIMAKGGWKDTEDPQMYGATDQPVILPEGTYILCPILPSL